MQGRARGAGGLYSVFPNRYSAPVELEGTFHPRQQGGKLALLSVFSNRSCEIVHMRTKVKNQSQLRHCVLCVNVDEALGPPINLFRERRSFNIPARSTFEGSGCRNKRQLVLGYCGGSNGSPNRLPTLYTANPGALLF